MVGVGRQRKHLFTLFFKMNYQTNLSDPQCEAKAHAKYAAQASKVIVEIGVLFGETTRLLLENSNCTVVGIDPIIPDSMNERLIGDLEKINNLVKGYDRFVFLKDFSYNIVKIWEKKIDYLFIDGDHAYNAVKRDFEEWFPFVKSGGVVSIHDSTANRGGPHNWPGPSQLADELIKDNRVKYLEAVGVLTVFEKL